MSNRYRSTKSAPPLSPEQARANAISQAEERARRGFTPFTRAARAEQVYNATPGENKLQSARRISQDRRRP